MTQERPSRVDTTAWRLAGSVGSWLLFSYFLVGFLQATATVFGLGGSCASGGPYVIASPCPDAVTLFVPLAIFGILFSWGVALFLSGGVGVSLVAWGWPVMFVGIGAQFLLDAARGQGIVVNLVCAAIAIGLGVLPAWFVVRNGALLPTLLGTRRVTGESFAFAKEARRYFGLKRADAGEAVAPTARDWLVVVLLWLLPTAAGSWLAVLTFTALATS